MPQELQERFCKPLFVGANPTGGSILNQERVVISSISPCDGDGPGATPGFLTNFTVSVDRCFR